MKKFRNVVALLLCLVLTLSLGTANASAVDVSGNDSFKSISCNGVKEFPAMSREVRNLGTPRNELSCA
jgi:ABC-type oligopeptide transport system substrate-binding subunit